jgi:SAM-dependent methyltransferase
VEQQIGNAIFVGEPARFVAGISSYLADAQVNWDSSLELLHADSTETHFIDILTRTAVCDAISRNMPSCSRILEVGCSSGLMLAALGAQWPDAQVAGLDALADGLPAARARAPRAEVVHASATDLPVADHSVHAVVTVNVLEHVAEDFAALYEAARVLRPGGLFVGVVPNNPGLYDYFDEHLSHERRYRRGELAVLASRAGLDVLEERYLGQYVYPPFWVIKKYNRRTGNRMSCTERANRVALDVTKTSDSRFGSATAKFESALLRRGFGFPFGIRQMVVARKGLG